MRRNAGDWMQPYRNLPDTPTIVILYHPPVHTSVPWLDGFDLYEAEALGKVIVQHDQILSILSGQYSRFGLVSSL
jgi:hypothetical protein